MKSLLLLLSFFMSITYSFSQKQVEIDGFVLASPKPNQLTIKGPGFIVYTSAEIWKLNTWQHYQETKDSITYTPFSSVRGYCPQGKLNKRSSVRPGIYVLRIVYNYKTASKRKEYVKQLDTRTEAQKNMKETIFVEKNVDVDGFVLTATKPTVLTLIEPTYSESLILEIWEKKAWRNHINNKRINNFPRYSKVSNGNTEVGRTSTIKVTPGDYVMSIDLMNKITGERKTHQKILNTETGKPNEVHGDGFSIKFTPDKN